MSGFSRWSSTSAVLLTLGMTTGAMTWQGELLRPLVATAQTAATSIGNGEANGFIRNGSTTYRFRNTAKRNAPTEKAVGQEFNLTASQGDEVEFSVDVEDGSNLRPILILINTRTGKQVAFDNQTYSLSYKVPTAGPYRLLVLAQGNTRGRYTLTTAGIGQVAAVPQADQVMTDTLRLRVIGCGVPNVARIKIGGEERCTRDIEVGQYTYDEASRSLKVVDTRKDAIGQRLQLSMLERCPTVTTSVVKINVSDPQDGRQYTYCANPTRFVAAGDYTYDLTSDRLQPGSGSSPISQPSTTPPAANDERRQLLQREYGLTVLDNCPPSRSSLVVVAFADASAANQGYVYCANPNRFLAAGEYVYNATTARLEPARKVQDCAFSLSGICLIK